MAHYKLGIYFIFNYVYLFTIEIYPRNDRSAPSAVQNDTTMLGFRVANIDAVLIKLQEIADTVLPTIKSTPWGRRIVLTDPDDRKVELTEL
ncbi:MAG: hypothetical protein V7L01_18470 [Nostoc sp.]|uniref:hypothetical protein n=1 Tax=Nostoc sp. TaxID=1180 RepID=UPI002FF8C1BC